MKGATLPKFASMPKVPYDLFQYAKVLLEQTSQAFLMANKLMTDYSIKSQAQSAEEGFISGKA